MLNRPFLSVNRAANAAITRVARTSSFSKDIQPPHTSDRRRKIALPALEILKNKFEETHDIPSSQALHDLSKDLELPWSTLYNWFWRQKHKLLQPPAREQPPARSQTTLLILLEQTFKDNPKPSRPEFESLAKSTGIDRRRLYHWFNYRRVKERQLKSNASRPTQRPTLFTKAGPSVVAELETFFAGNPSPTASEISNLEEQLGLANLYKWFYDRRLRDSLANHNAMEQRPTLLTRIGSSNMAILEDAFKRHPCMKGLELEGLAEKFDVPYVSLRAWFQRRRTKEKKLADALTESEPKLVR